MSINFRANEEDAKVLDLIAAQHPVIVTNHPDALRVALESYWVQHAPEAGQSKGAKLDEILEELTRMNERAKKWEGV